MQKWIEGGDTWEVRYRGETREIKREIKEGQRCEVTDLHDSLCEKTEGSRHHEALKGMFFIDEDFMNNTDNLSQSTPSSPSGKIEIPFVRCTQGLNRLLDKLWSSRKGGK